jgi:hypothetical protein
MCLSHPFPIIATSLEPLKDDIIHASCEQKQYAILFIQFLDNDAHQFPGTCELQNIKQFIPLNLPLMSVKDEPAAAWTRAASSGDCALYSMAPVAGLTAVKTV